jgi:eukaryotic-like serine/threonine-protein kinase
LVVVVSLGGTFYAYRDLIPRQPPPLAAPPNAASTPTLPPPISQGAPSQDATNSSQRAPSSPDQSPSNAPVNMEDSKDAPSKEPNAQGSYQTPNRPPGEGAGSQAHPPPAAAPSSDAQKNAPQQEPERPEPAPPSSPAATQPTAPGAATSAERGAAVIRDFKGGSCFWVRAIDIDAPKPAILGVGADRAAFERFAEEFRRTVGVEPNLVVRPIEWSQCPVVGLIRAMADDAAPAPKIELSVPPVFGRNRPLSGSVSNLAGRSVALLEVNSDGRVRRIEARPAANGESATFSAPVSADVVSRETIEVVLAIVSPRPVAALADFTSGRADGILPKLQTELPAAGGALDADYFQIR